MSAPDIQADSSRKALQAGDDAAGRRLDQFLAAALAPDLSRSRIQTLIRDGHVVVGKSRIQEPKHRLSGGEEIVVALPAPEAAEPQAENIPLSILYEDADLIVIDKPAGLVVHPGAGNPSGTLVNALIHHCGDTLSGIGGVKRPGIVHRLDKDTSGVMVVAKTDTAHRALSEAFADHGRDGDLERAGMEGSAQLFLVAPDHALEIVDHDAAHCVMRIGLQHSCLPQEVVAQHSTAAIRAARNFCKSRHLTACLAGRL